MTETIRLAGPDDAAAAARLERTITVPAFAHIFPPERFPFPDQEVRAKWERELSDPAYACWWAERERDRALETVAELGHDHALLWVLAENPRARAFYARQGWRPDGVTGATEYPPHPRKPRYRLQLTGAQ
ncbi:hypothetical protein HJ590_12990 [Naumannella sp. ID2617S]|nr:hypothetical protein [Naumannella sp. ID2617S]